MNAPSDVVGRSAAILRALAAFEPAGASTSEISRATQLPRPTAHRLLVGLMEEGLADRDRGSGRWCLGPELYLFSVAASHRYDAADVARPCLVDLAARTGESAFFSARRGEESICILREEGSFPLRSHVLHEGIRFPLGVASAGLAMLSFLPERDIDEYLACSDLGSGYGAAHGEGPLRLRIAETRATGYATNPGLIVPGSWGLAAAVFDGRGRPQWALSLTGVEQRFTSERRSEMGALLLDSAHRLTRALARRAERKSREP